MNLGNDRIEQLFELLNERITALDQSVQSKEEGAYVCYEFADMQGNFLRMRLHTHCINVEVDIPRETIQDSQGLCYVSSVSGMWGSVITVSPESDIDYIMGLVKQVYDHNLRKEVKTVSDEKIRERELEIVRDSNILIIRFPEVLGDLAGATVIEVRFEGEQVSRFEMRRQLPTNDNQ